MKTPEEVVSIYDTRSSAHSRRKARQKQVRDQYNGDIVVPLPEISRTEQAAVANLLAQGLDQTAMRIASVTPNLLCPPTDNHSDRARQYAAIRKHAIYGWWEQSAMDLHLAKRARHFIGYSEAVTQIRWDAKVGIPRWVNRDPLCSYPSPVVTSDSVPADIVFGYERPVEWLRQHYPDAHAKLFKNVETEAHSQVTLIEYMNDEEMTLVAYRGIYTGLHGTSGPVCALLEQTENRIGRTPATVSDRISLDDPVGQFDGIMGMFQQQAKLMALEVLAVEKGVFPDTWLIGNAGEQPKIVNPANGITGEIGVVRGGELRDMQLQPGFMTNPAIDRLERAQRLQANIPAEFGGESASNIRTNRRGEAVLAATVNFGVAEAQKTIARGMTTENQLAIAMAKEYDPDRPKSFYVSFGKTHGQVDYTPSKHFTSDANKVSYSHAGADMNNLVISGGQRVQMGTLSKKSFMLVDPLVEDVEAEADAVVAEQLEESLLAGIQQQAAGGAIPPSDLARIIRLVKEDKANLAEAVEKVQREAQERQAEMVAPTAPEAQPGIAQPGAGAEAMTAAPPGEEGPGGLRDMLAQLGVA